MKDYYVYILASHKNGTFYTGMTFELVQRIWQHKSGTTPSFNSKYKVNQLVYFEQHGNVMEAIKREKIFKHGKGYEN